MRLVNLTPHRLRVLTETGQVLLDLPACLQPPRVLARETPRADLLFPDEEVRDRDGHIIGCRRLARFP